MKKNKILATTMVLAFGLSANANNTEQCGPNYAHVCTPSSFTCNIYEQVPDGGDLKDGNLSAVFTLSFDGGYEKVTLDSDAVEAKAAGPRTSSSSGRAVIPGSAKDVKLQADAAAAKLAADKLEEERIAAIRSGVTQDLNGDGNVDDADRDKAVADDAAAVAAEPKPSDLPMRSLSITSVGKPVVEIVELANTGLQVNQSTSRLEGTKRYYILRNLSLHIEDEVKTADGRIQGMQSGGYNVALTATKVNFDAVTGSGGNLNYAWGFESQIQGRKIDCRNSFERLIAVVPDSDTRQPSNALNLTQAATAARAAANRPKASKQDKEKAQKAYDAVVAQCQGKVTETLTGEVLCLYNMQ